MKKLIFSHKEMAHFASGMGNVSLVLACLILIPYLVAPIFGGKFQVRALILYGSWIGMALIMKYVSKYSRDRIRMNKRKWYFISILMSLLILVWFPNYFGLIMSVLLVFGNMTSYRRLGKLGWQDEH